MLRIWVGSLALVVLVVFVPTAGAATLSLVHVRTEPGIPAPKGMSIPPLDVYTARLVDEASEDNRVVVATEAGSTYRVRARDEAVPVRAGERCAAAPDGVVACEAVPTSPGNAVRVTWEVDAGGGDDRFENRPDDFMTIALSLGTGNDDARLFGAVGTADGGPGTDAVRGENRTDAELSTITSGGDTIVTFGALTWTGGAGPDRAGGNGVVASYAERANPVRVTPDGVADDGEPGEGDDIGPDASVVIGGSGDDELWSPRRGASGGPGNDTLIGSETVAPGSPFIGEVLAGGSGNDVMRGGAGHDRLAGGPGDDRLEAGDGDDALDDGDGSDRLDGGAGADHTDSSEAIAAADVWNGGDGHDRIDRDEGSVTLDGAANDGADGEGDNVLPGWETVTMSSGTIVGSAADEVLRMSGRGRIDGGAGDDDIWGGTDVVGGPGRDTIDSEGIFAFDRRRPIRIDLRDGEEDALSCDLPVRLERDRVDRVKGCSAYAWVRRFTSRRTITAASRIPVRVVCEGFEACRGRLFVRRSIEGRILDVQRFRVGPNRTKRVAIRLGRRVSALRKRCGRVWIYARTSSPFAPGYSETIGQNGRLGIPVGSPARCR